MDLESREGAGKSCLDSQRAMGSVQSVTCASSNF